MLPFNTPDKLCEILGQTYFERLTETSLNSADELFTLIQDYQIDCEARQNGWLRVCYSANALKQAKAGVDEWNKHGAGIEVVDRDELEIRSGTKAYHAGIVTPKGGAVHPLSLAIGLAKAAERHECSIYGNSAVTSIEKEKTSGC